MVYSDSNLYCFLFELFSTESFARVLTDFQKKQYLVLYIQMNVLEGFNEKTILFILSAE